MFSLLAVLVSYQLGIFIGKMQNLNPELLRVEAKTLAFATLIVSNLCLILVNRSWSKTIFTLTREYNAVLLYVTTGALILHIAIFFSGESFLFFLLTMLSITRLQDRWIARFQSCILFTQFGRFYSWIIL